MVCKTKDQTDPNLMSSLSNSSRHEIHLWIIHWNVTYVTWTEFVVCKCHYPNTLDMWFLIMTYATYFNRHSHRYFRLLFHLLMATKPFWINLSPQVRYMRHMDDFLPWRCVAMVSSVPARLCLMQGKMHKVHLTLLQQRSQELACYDIENWTAPAARIVHCRMGALAKETMWTGKAHSYRFG